MVSPSRLSYASLDAHLPVPEIYLLTDAEKKSNHSGKKRGYLGMPLGEIFMQPSVEIIDRVCDTKKREKEKELKSFGHNKLSYLSKPCLWGPEGFVVGALG